jgi:RHS repeat-associated protein
VRVVRRYDSLKRNQNQDFGFGWSVDYQNAAVRKNMTLGLGWQITNIFTQFKLCLSPAGNRKVAVTLPDGKVERFVAYNDPECTTFMVPPLNVKFTAQPGTTSRLEVLDSTALVQSEGGMLLDYSNGLPWNPKHFKLTTEDGYSYYLTEGVGLEKVQDPFGNTLTYSKNGIVHSAGLSVAFQRDGQGRITRITDPQGQSLQYSYTPQGELAAHTDRSGQTDSFRYGGGHLLAAYTDPRGVTTASQDYDSQGRLSAVTDADGHRTQLGFDDTANRQTVTDRLGHRTTYTYDDSGNVTAVTDALGNTTASTYDSLGNETASTDPLGHTTVRTYSPLSQQLSETDPLGHTQTWRYGIGVDPHPLASHQDPLGNSTQYAYFGAAPISISEPLGRTTSLSYDNQGNLTALGLPGGQTSAYTYNAQGQRTSETDPAGHTTTYRLDADGRELARTWTRTASDGSVLTLNSQRSLDPEGRALSDTDPTGATTTRQYNGAGKVSQETDPLGRTTTYTYDNQARPVQTAYPDGSSEAQGYDANGNLIAESDRAGRITRHTYDSLNRPVQTVRPDGGSEITAYDPAGHVTQSTDALGHTTTYSYDPAGRLTRSADPLGNTTTYSYDANGNRTQTTAPDGQTTAYTYDALNRLTQTTYPDGTRSQTDWRSDGLKQAETAPDGSVRRYAYDPAGRLSQVTEHNGGETTTYTYDEAGNKTAQTDAQGRTTRWDYDNANRPVRRTLPGGGQETFQYDIAGRLTAHTRFDGQTTRYGYDDADRRNLAVYPDGRSPNWTYTPDGLPASATDSHNRPTAYQYGSQGQRRQETRPDGTVLVWDTDAQGNTTARTTPTGTHRYAYDAAGRLTQATDQHNQTTTYTYDPVGRPLNQTRPNGSQTTRRYDANGRLTQLLHTAPDGTLTSGTAYRLAPDGRRSTQTDYDNQSALDSNGQPQNPLRSTAYTYDASGRLTNADTTGRDGQTQLIGYTYDKTGNRQQQTVTTVAQTQTTTYTYDTDDRLTQETTITADNTNSTNTSSQTTTYTWDTDGRLTQKQSPAGATLYTYDSQDRLTGVKRGADPASAQTLTTYAYDADGNRSQKTVKTAQGDQVTTYLIDNTFAYPQVAEETTTLGNTTQTTRYLWADGQLIAATQSTSINGNRQPPTTSYYHSDGLGSITALTDAQGNLTDTYAYRPFGETDGHNGNSQQPYRFAGEHLDPEAAMQYHRARWYDPSTGRFTAMDPLSGKPSRPATLHKYAYANNDPVNQIDPTGKFSIGSVMVGINIGIQLTSISYGYYQLYKGNYTAAAWIFAESAFFGIVGYKKSVAWLQWWSKNRAIRQSYNTLLNQILAEVSIMKKAGKSEKEIAERLVKLRNEAKATERAKMDPRDVAELEKRNIEKYNDPLGPTVEYLTNKGKTYGEIIESATESNFWYNLFFFSF